jgi:hypothetical protein
MPGLLAWLDRVAGSRLFAYGSVFLIQAKVLWGIWDHRDLTPGDTAIYFANASRWADHLQLDPDFYPLYHALWGSMQWFIDDAFTLTIVHRVLIAFGAALLVLAVLRRMLTPGIAWALAVWWAVLPVNYDTLYEVHLFAVIPVMIATLIALNWSGLAMRATVFGLLLTSALLVRTENFVAALAWGAAWAGYELWLRRRGEGPPVRQLAVAVAVPIAAMAVLLAVVSSRSEEVRQGSSVAEQFRSKHELNVCQTYAFGLWQRDDFRGPNPLGSGTACQQYMLKDFSAPDLSLTKAIAENPGAMGEFFLWNVALTPFGLQLSLFDNAWPDGPSPDYFPVEMGSPLALIGSLAVLTLLAVGGTQLWRDRRRWWDEWLRDRAWGWLVLICVALSTLVVMLITRPRPSYMLSLTVLIFGLIGLCAMAIVTRKPDLARLRAALPLLAVITLVAVPSHYGEGYENPLIGEGQRLKQTVERLAPFRDQLSGPEVGLLAAFPENIGCSYIGRSDPCTDLTWEEPPEASLQRHLAAGDVDYVYAGEEELAKPAWRKAVAQLEADGWVRLAPSAADDLGWVFLRRPTG